MDGKKKIKLPSESDQHHRVKRLLQELEHEFNTLILENQNCNQYFSHKKIISLFKSIINIKMTLI